MVTVVCPRRDRAPGGMKLSRPEPGNASMVLMVFGFIAVLAVLLIIGATVL